MLPVLQRDTADRLTLPLPEAAKFLTHYRRYFRELPLVRPTVVCPFFQFFQMFSASKLVARSKSEIRKVDSALAPPQNAS